MRDTPRPRPTADLDSVEEIAEMVRRFYADVAMDDLLGPVFEEVAQVDWAEHLPKLTAFWARALLGEPATPAVRSGRMPRSTHGRRSRLPTSDAGSPSSTRRSSWDGWDHGLIERCRWLTTSPASTAISWWARPSRSSRGARAGRPWRRGRGCVPPGGAGGSASIAARRHEPGRCRSRSRRGSSTASRR